MNIYIKPTHFEPNMCQKRVKKGECLDIWVFWAILQLYYYSCFNSTFKPLLPTLWNTETFQTGNSWPNHTFYNTFLQYLFQYIMRDWLGEGLVATGFFSDSLL